VIGDAIELGQQDAAPRNISDDGRSASRPELVYLARLVLSSRMAMSCDRGNAAGGAAGGPNPKTRTGRGQLGHPPGIAVTLVEAEVQFNEARLYPGRRPCDRRAGTRPRRTGKDG